MLIDTKGKNEMEFLLRFVIFIAFIENCDKCELAFQ